MKLLTLFLFFLRIPSVETVIGVWTERALTCASKHGCRALSSWTQEVSMHFQTAYRLDQ
jgi:hypothetical protein